MRFKSAVTHYFLESKDSNPPQKKKQQKTVKPKNQPIPFSFIIKRRPETYIWVINQHHLPQKLNHSAPRLLRPCNIPPWITSSAQVELCMPVSEVVQIARESLTDSC